MKRIGMLLCISLLTIALLLAGCSSTPRQEDLYGKIFIYEKEGFGGNFFITVQEDGTFTYYEGSLSSYLGFGTWTLEGDLLTLTDTVREDHPRVFCFRFTGDELIYIAERSDEFTFIKVADGERFSAAKASS
ncbi:MAG: hypothetical protein E7666_04545 [Ruminococcaceae bacterium]|nr:hypothetical protein [Oscillospiraceae bacterium]